MKVVYATERPFSEKEHDPGGAGGYEEVEPPEPAPFHESCVAWCHRIVQASLDEPPL